jgi:hypothetical protein
MNTKKYLFFFFIFFYPIFTNKEYICKILLYEYESTWDENDN